MFFSAIKENAEPSSGKEHKIFRNFVRRVYILNESMNEMLTFQRFLRSYALFFKVATKVGD